MLPAMKSKKGMTSTAPQPARPSVWPVIKITPEDADLQQAAYRATWLVWQPGKLIYDRWYVFRLKGEGKALLNE